jgi:hypothetical protein
MKEQVEKVMNLEFIVRGIWHPTRAQERTLRPEFRRYNSLSGKCIGSY